ncbi:MAG: hypothetical protein ACP5IX_01045 [Patescibacteria group bacterium]
MREAERKYTPESEGKFLGYIKTKILELHRQGLESVELGKKYDELKQEFIKENPDSVEVIEAIFGIKDVARIEQELSVAKNKKLRIEREKLKEMMRNLTQWHFLLTNLLIQIKDKSFASSFWSELGAIYKSFSDRPIKGIRKGIVGQVGVYKTLEKFGLQPRIAHPDEDAFEKMDLWVSLPTAEVAIQTKYTQKIEQPLIVKDDIDYPSVLIESLDKETYVSHYDIEQMIRLRESCRKKAKQTGKKIQSLYLSIPEGSFDPDTGEPTEEFLKQIEPEIGKYLK